MVLHRQIIIRRDSHEENTFAVVRFLGCLEDQLLGKLHEAVQAWAKTEEGQEALNNAADDFNVGDLANYTPAREGGALAGCLHDAGVSALDIDVFSDDGAHPWDFDTKLS